MQSEDGSVPDVVPDSVSESEELSGVMNALGIDDDVLLVSTQYGWMSTLRCALRNKESVVGVVLVDPLVPRPSIGPELRHSLMPPVRATCTCVVMCAAVVLRVRRYVSSFVQRRVPSCGVYCPVAAS